MQLEAGKGQVQSRIWVFQVSFLVPLKLIRCWISLWSQETAWRWRPTEQVEGSISLTVLILNIVVSVRLVSQRTIPFSLSSHYTQAAFFHVSSAHPLRLPCPKFKLLVPCSSCSFLLFLSMWELLLKGVRWRGQPQSIPRPRQHRPMYYTHTHTHCFKCQEMHSKGWGSLIDWLSWGPWLW